MLKKNYVFKTFTNFSKKNIHGNENFNKKLFLLKYSIDLEKKYRNQVTILIKERILLKFIFHQNFLFKKKGENFNKIIFFSTYLYKLGNISLRQLVEGTLLLQEKIFNWLLKRVF